MVVFGILGFIIGTILGSFSGAWADRYIRNKSLNGRSECVSCKHKLSWFDLVPIFSYLLLKGKCRFCSKKIPLENLLVEAVLGVLTALIFIQAYNLNYFYGISLLLFYILAFLLFVVVILSTIFIIDLKIGLIPDKIIFPATGVAFLYWIIGIIVFKTSWEEFAWALISASCAPLFFVSLILITRGRGMGWGDVKFAFFLGLILGFPNIVVALFLAFLFGALFSVALIIKGKKKIGSTIPFGPFLSLGAITSLLIGTKILTWYLNLIRY